MDAQYHALGWLTDLLFDLYDAGYPESAPAVQRLWPALDSLREQVRTVYTCGCC